MWRLNQHLCCPRPLTACSGQQMSPLARPPFHPPGHVCLLGSARCLVAVGRSTACGMEGRPGRGGWQGVPEVWALGSWEEAPADTPISSPLLTLDPLFPPPTGLACPLTPAQPPLTPAQPPLTLAQPPLTPAQPILGPAATHPCTGGHRPSAHTMPLQVPTLPASPSPLADGCCGWTRPHPAAHPGLGGQGS